MKNGLTFLSNAAAEIADIRPGIIFGLLLIAMPWAIDFFDDLLKRYAERESPATAPDRLPRIFSLLLPKRAREHYFAPRLEELKEDRIMAELDAETDFQMRFIALRFSLKTAVAFASALGCSLSDLAGKLIPWLKKLFFGTGS